MVSKELNMNFPSDLETLALVEWVDVSRDGVRGYEAVYPNGLGYMRIEGNTLYFFEGNNLVKTLVLVSA
jgi:hypothetical protein